VFDANTRCTDFRCEWEEDGKSHCVRLLLGTLTTHAWLFNAIVIYSVFLATKIPGGLSLRSDDHSTMQSFNLPCADANGVHLEPGESNFDCLNPLDGCNVCSNCSCSAEGKLLRYEELAEDEIDLC